MECECESLGGGVFIYVDRTHRFGTDAFLLASFSRMKAGETACDLCSGCGIVGLLWQRKPGQRPARTWCVELQPQAAALISRSVQESGLQGQVTVIEKDLRALDREDIPPGTLDLCACNPPYQAAGHGLLPEQQAKALARHGIGCSLEEVAAAAARLLRFGGRFCLCQRPERLCDVFAALRANGMEPKRLRLVQKRPDTAPWLALVEGRRGGRPFLTVEPPLLIQDAAGGFSPELQKIYGDFG